MMRKPNRICDFYEYIYYNYNKVISVSSMLPSSNSYKYILDSWLFWQEYNDNYGGIQKIIDMRMLTLFGNFESCRTPYDFEIDIYKYNPDGDVYMYLSLFLDGIISLFTANAKKYNEIWRVNVVNDDDYMLLNNYDMSETITRNLSAKGSANNTTQVGNQTSTNTDKSAPYDSESFYNDMQRTNTIGAREDSGNTITDNSETETTTTNKRGNIGVQTGSDMLEKHQKLWTKFEFYDMILKDIAKELLYLAD